MSKPMMVLIISGVLSCSGSPKFPLGRVIDLTHPLDSTTIYWPTESGFELQQVFEGVTAGGFFYVANSFCTPEHGGTHVDAPLHFSQDGNSMDRIPLEQLLGFGIVVDVRAQCTSDRDYQILIEDIVTWENRNGSVRQESIVLFRTGFSRYWPDRKDYMGTDERGENAVAKLRFPGLHPETAQWLVQSRKVKAIGLDTPSIDYGQSTTFMSHRILSERNIPVLENVASMDSLPESGFMVIALPMKIKGGSGGPVRLIALLDRP